MLKDNGIEYTKGCNAGFFVWLNLGKKYFEANPGEKVRSGTELTDMIMQRLLDNKVFLASATGFGSEKPGTFTREISTESGQAQVWFNRGLIWSYSFDHDEACKCFKQAIAHDGMCAMAYCDLQQSMKRCHDAARKARELVSTGQATITSIEAALIHAIQSRFPVDHSVEDFSVLDKEYASAVEKVYHQYGENHLDVVTLVVFPLRALQSTKSSVSLVVVFNIRMQTAIQASYIFSSTSLRDRRPPPAALPAADKLRNLVPDAGHMHHMPTHLDVLVGDRRSIDSDTAAVRADEKYLARERAKNFCSFYRLRNYQSLIYAAMLAGQSKVAMKALNDMEASITDDVLRVKSPPLADWMEFFKAVRVHVYIRFGIARAAMGNIAEAEQERELYHAAAKRVPPTRKDFPNLIVDVLKIATAMLDGEIQYRRGNFTSAFEYLREVIRHDDSLLGHVEEALRAYAEDGSLTRAHQYPNNVWALHCMGIMSVS
ncbi:hypothetical protein CNMCM8927_007715 [Aspergillus lentulus]|uniref:Uncharacterized protein n=1 Tax=Aspergillus lentulus TaxID=293939 RepID=A0AAN5YNE7_ASPLE|nr:hypothetical protein CNMCM8060_007660 [Aspergillus lentulus]KAF4194480.1 hypothetical protein CNMCM8694_007397 [Aspergillus lentulus]KAF4204228.1 hypothetical protein CNMCM8927_007715 [Aspergillus lentulus]